VRLYVAGTFAAIGVALAVAACGSSGSSGATTGSKPGSGVAFAQCMRTHGVPNFPDPSGGGGIRIPDGINPAAPSFRTAQAKCSNLLPGGGPPRSGGDLARNKAEMLAVSRCMRAHGVTGFPDPVSSAPG
jgi:hypothetical protein